MKIIEHGNRFVEVSVKCSCEKCRCKFEVAEHELEGNSSRFCWCPECKETVWVPEREVTKAVEVAVVARIREQY